MSAQSINYYNELTDMSNGKYFTISYETKTGYTFAAGVVHGIYYNLIQGLLKEKEITQAQITTYQDALNSSLAYVGTNGHGHIVDNATLNTGIEGLTMKYGWTNSATSTPPKTVDDYKDLIDMWNGDYFTISYETKTGYTFAAGVVHDTYHNPIVGLT